MNGERWTLDGLIAQQPPRDCEFVLATDFDALEAALRGFAELEPRPEEYINQSEWKQGALDMAAGVARTARRALAEPETEVNK